MAKKKTNKEIELKTWRINSLRYSLSLPLYLIFLLLLWHWNYKIAFGIFSVLIIIEYIGITIKMNKFKRK